MKVFSTWCRKSGKSSHSGRIGEACHGSFLLVPGLRSIRSIGDQVTLLLRLEIDYKAWKVAIRFL